MSRTGHRARGEPVFSRSARRASKSSMMISARAFSSLCDTTRTRTASRSSDGRVTKTPSPKDRLVSALLSASLLENFLGTVIRQEEEEVEEEEGVPFLFPTRLSSCVMPSRTSDWKKA